jgi:regulator of sigma E protease
MDVINLIWANGLSFVVILSVIVFGHELGHYLIARYNDVRVEVFSIGFGPEIFGWDDKAGTRWKVSLLPLGGYVKFFGDADAASTPGEDVPEMAEADRAVSFHHKRLGQRAAIVLGGPLANFVLAIIIFAIMFATVGQRITPADISIVRPGSPAESAGVLPGDKIIGIDGEAIDRFETLQKMVRVSAGESMIFTIMRDGDEIEVIIVPNMVEITDRFGNLQSFGQIGVGRTGVEFVRLDPLTASWAAVVETWSLTIMTLDALGCLCSTMFRVSPNHLCWVLEGLVDGDVHNQIIVPDDEKQWSRTALDRMLSIQ